MERKTFEKVFPPNLLFKTFSYPPDPSGGREKVDHQKFCYTIYQRNNALLRTYRLEQSFNTSHGLRFAKNFHRLK